MHCLRCLGLGLALIGMACSSDDTGNEDGADDTSGGGSSTASTSVGTTASTSTSTTVSSTDATTATTVSSTETSGDDSGTTTDPTDTDTGGGVCETCVGGYCDWSANSCGLARFDEPSCTPLPPGCPDVQEDPACGCDGIVYAGACAAALLGVDIDAAGACPTPAGRFACGYAYCDVQTSYCQWSVSDVGGSADGYACVPLPLGCGDAPSCECLLEEPCGSFACEATDDGGLQVTCPGG